MHSSVKESLNKEKFWELRDESGELLEDGPGKTQTLYKAACTACPFPNCTSAAFERAKKHWWSLKGQDAVLSYIKNHGKWSTNHGKNESNPLSEQDIDDALVGIEFTESEQDHDSRVDYKRQIDAIEEEKATRQKEAKDAKRWKSNEWSSSAGWRSDQNSSSSNVWNPAAQDNVASDLAKLTETVHSLQQSQLALQNAGVQQLQVQQPPAPWAQTLVEQKTAAEWDPSMQMAVQEQTISLLYAQLSLYKETIDRTKEAAKASMASMCTSLQKLQNEIGILNNASVVIDEILQKGK